MLFEPAFDDTEGGNNPDEGIVDEDDEEDEPPPTPPILGYEYCGASSVTVSPNGAG
jgi:hypothetical protein